MVKHRVFHNLVGLLNTDMMCLQDRNKFSQLCDSLRDLGAPKKLKHRMSKMLRSAWFIHKTAYMNVMLDKPSFLGICMFLCFLFFAHPQSLSKSNFERTGPQGCFEGEAMDLVHSWPRPRGRLQIYLGFAFNAKTINGWLFGMSEPSIVLRWWQLKYFLCSSQNLGKMNPFWRAYFSNGLVKPPTSFA